MTHKQIANRLREIIQGEGPHPYAQLELLADTLDPPRPEPGTVVWWRYKYAGGPEYKYLGIVEDRGEGIIDAGQEFHEWGDIEYRPARILADDEVAMKVPPVREWQRKFRELEINVFTPGTGDIYHRKIITRAEAEAQEAGR